MGFLAGVGHFLFKPMMERALFLLRFMYGYGIMKKNAFISWQSTPKAHANIAGE